MQAKFKISYKSLNTLRDSSQICVSFVHRRKFPVRKVFSVAFIQNGSPSSSLLFAKLNADKRRLTSSPRRFCVANQVAAAANRHCRGKSSRVGRSFRARQSAIKSRAFSSCCYFAAKLAARRDNWRRTIDMISLRSSFTFITNFSNQKVSN